MFLTGTSAAAKRRPSWAAVASLTLLFALLIVMTPELARVPSTTAAPQPLGAPSPSATVHATAIDDPVVIAPTPEPGPHPDD